MDVLERKIEKAPFWVVHRHLRVSATLSGLVTNDNFEVLDSNLDWGVEEYRLAQWLRKRPDLDCLNVTLWSEGWREIHKEFAEHVSELGFAQPYWHAISVNCLYERDETHRYLWKKEPEAIIGYSIYVYRVDPKVDRPSY